MLMLQNAYRITFFLFLLLCTPMCVYGDHYPHSVGDLNTSTEILKTGMIQQNVISKSSSSSSCTKKRKKHIKLSYYLYIADFIKSFIEIPTSNVAVDSSTISSKYLAGRASVYNKKNQKAGICSASFLCMQNATGIYTDIANYLSIDNGLIVTWFTPTTLINLELDSILHSMVTECIVTASTKVGVNPFYGEKFNMVVSSDNNKIYFKLSSVKKISVCE